MLSTIRYQLQTYINTTHPRTRKIHINTVFSLFSKAGSMGVSLLLVPLTIDYLSEATYGTWVTISSMTSMLMFFDLGIGNGLRNKFAEAVSKQDRRLAQTLVSTAYGIFGIVQIGFIVLFFLFINYIPWARLLNTTIDQQQLQLVLLVMIVAMAIKLVLDILTYVLLALQESGQVNVINFLANGLVLITTYALTQFSHNKLIYLAAVTALSPILVLLVSGILFYRSRLTIYRPLVGLIDWTHARSILSLGYKFFLIQLCFIVVFYTDNLLINYLFGPVAVTTYSIAFRYFMIVNTLFGLVAVPYWSAFTEASTRNDITWMKQTCRHLYKLWLGLVGVVTLMVVFAQPVYTLWVGQRVSVPVELSSSLGLFVIITNWNLVASTVLNGLGKMRLQVYYALLTAVTNVALALFFGKFLGWGSTGVVLASVVALLWGAILGTIQMYKLLKGTASGFWNQ
ncbi:MATE family efflux transporter [Spirosoma sp. RP8]|uniref:MATE family efflux transporter n=1 Tax=Spirosoma liriopis TaxID=2937440 RepID=A0ABT0HKG3_9BACT|nr:oligosaccharide flippase family protein [Spirosoma liriopis]MCK8492662.1 MATE family efflux transporter [Spirosoma liriopis]